MNRKNPHQKKIGIITIVLNMVASIASLVWYIPTIDEVDLSTLVELQLYIVFLPHLLFTVGLIFIIKARDLDQIISPGKSFNVLVTSSYFFLSLISSTSLILANIARQSAIWAISSIMIITIQLIGLLFMGYTSIQDPNQPTRSDTFSEYKESQSRMTAFLSFYRRTLLFYFIFIVPSGLLMQQTSTQSFSSVLPFFIISLLWPLIILLFIILGLASIFDPSSGSMEYLPMVVLILFIILIPLIISILLGKLLTTYKEKFIEKSRVLNTEIKREKLS